MADTDKKQFAADLSQTYSDLFNPRFADSGRQGSLSEQLDAAVAAPARVGINELQKGNWNAGTVKKVLQAIGKDPQNAPTSLDIAEETGVENPYVGAGIATAADIANHLLTPSPGIKGTVAKVAKTAQNAKAIRGLKPVQFEKSLVPEMLPITAKSTAQKTIEGLKGKPVISNAAAKSNEILGGANYNKYVDAAEMQGTAKASVNANNRPDAGFGRIKVK